MCQYYEMGVVSGCETCCKIAKRLSINNNIFIIKNRIYNLT